LRKTPWVFLGYADVTRMNFVSGLGAGTHAAQAQQASTKEFGMDSATGASKQLPRAASTTTVGLACERPPQKMGTSRFQLVGTSALRGVEPIGFGWINCERRVVPLGTLMFERSVTCS
jgi:hypothetical protein